MEASKPVGRAAKGSFLGLRGNAKVCISLLPLWGIPYVFYFFYLSLYLRECGVSDRGLGTLMLASSAASVLFAFVAASLVDRLGRKRSTFVFDLMSSALPPLIFALSGSFAFAFLAFILSSANKVMSVGYYLLMSEDASDAERVTAFNLFNVIIVAAGIFVPVTSGLVARFGLLATERFFLFFSAVSMAVLAVLRNHLVGETTVGKAIMERRRQEKPKARELVEPYLVALRYLSAHPLALAASLANVLFYVYYIVGTNNGLYFTPYFGDALGIDAAGAALLGSVYAGATLFSMLALNPALRRLGVIGCAILGSVVDAAGLALLAFAPRGNFAWALAAVAISALGYGILKSAIDAAIVVTSEGEARTGIYSTANIISSLLGIGAGFLLGLLYAGNPRSLYALSFVIVLAIPLCFAVSRMLTPRAGRRAGRSQGGPLPH